MEAKDALQNSFPSPLASLNPGGTLFTRCRYRAEMTYGGTDKDSRQKEKKKKVQRKYKQAYVL